jgi:hypothetical protein
MTTTIHGYVGGIAKLLQDIFVKASRGDDAKFHVEGLCQLLKC